EARATPGHSALVQWEGEGQKTQRPERRKADTLNRGRPIGRRARSSWTWRIQAPIRSLVCLRVFARQDEEFPGFSSRVNLLSSAVSAASEVRLEAGRGGAHAVESSAEGGVGCAQSLHDQ